MQEVQDACVQGNASLKVHCQNAPVKKTHVTVLVAHVTEPQLETAKALVDNVLQNKILPHLPHKEFKISFKGMSSFGEKIVYAEVADGESELRMMNEAFLEAFETAGFDCDSRYTPHMTVMKVAIKLSFKLSCLKLNHFRVDSQTSAFHVTRSTTLVTKTLGAK